VIKTNKFSKPARKRRWHYLIAAPVAAALVILTGVAPANAWYYSGGMPYATYSIKPWNYNSTWTTPMNNALASWNAHGKVNITKSSRAAAYVTVASYSAAWYGLYTPGTNTFNIKLNSRTLAAAAGVFANVSRSTFAHELGHSLSLADNPVTDSASLMKHNRNRNTLYSPTSWDNACVNSVY